MTRMAGISVLVLGGGVGGEREVSVLGAAAVAAALEQTGVFRVEKRIIETITLDQLGALPGECVFPVLHGPWGEGGPMQDLLIADGRPFVGSGPGAARLAMDKIALKSIAANLGVNAAISAVLDPDDPVCPMPLPVVVKPIREGSTVGLFICRSLDDWRRAHAMSAASGRQCMIEPYVEGRELTVGVVGDEALPIIEIVAPGGLYDYEAKYTRSDTIYRVNPDLPMGVADQLKSDSVRIAQRIGVRHLCRVDFLLDGAGRAWLLELNTMPGFTDHSLVPMAARARAPAPLEMPWLCAALVELALADAAVEATR